MGIGEPGAVSRQYYRLRFSFCLEIASGFLRLADVSIFCRICRYLGGTAACCPALDLISDEKPLVRLNNVQSVIPSGVRER